MLGTNSTCCRTDAHIFSYCGRKHKLENVAMCVHLHACLCVSLLYETWFDPAYCCMTCSHAYIWLKSRIYWMEAKPPSLRWLPWVVWSPTENSFLHPGLNLTTEERISANILTFDHCDNSQFIGHRTSSQDISSTRSLQTLLPTQWAREQTGRGQAVPWGYTHFMSTP